MHIELNRTFRELSHANVLGSDAESLYPSGDSLTWESLLSEHRVVLLSEAGSGKTQEIRETAKKLRGQGKFAFFLRLEHVGTDFDSAFEEGTIEEFQSWLTSTDPGWLFLDSIDESRLKEPADFHRAIRIVSTRLRTAKQRTHIFITGRAPAWRPLTDRDLCERLFPYLASKVAVVDQPSNGQSATIRRHEASQTPSDFAFKVLSLDDLSPEQIERFARGKGVSDTKAFLTAVERADAWSFTARPQDLDEVAEFWNDEGRIGSRFDLMKNSIARRLKERDQTRNEAKELAPDRAREGARLLAAAATLMQQQTIQVPDGANSISGLKVESILTGWTATDCVTLLSRPLFDGAIYGSVRFHHRSVREYLTAEWFAGLLRQETSRRTVEQLFFCNQYGLEVVVPSLRPILPWLAMLDGKILERVRRVAPEIVFEGGDPSQLPPQVRCHILEQACAQLASGTSKRSMADFAAIQRFASADLTGKVKELIELYTGNDDIVSFLLRMVWQGRLAGCIDEAMHVATNTGFKCYSRICAFRAIADLGTEQDMAEVRQVFATEAAELDRELLAELVSHIEPTSQVLAWLYDCLKHVANMDQYKVDHLGDRIASLIARVNVRQLVSIVERLTELLKTPPLVEHRHCEISTRYRWLLRPAGMAVERLLKARDTGVLEPSALSILHLLPVAGEHMVTGFDHSELEVKTFVGQWPAVKWALFWHIVAEERRWLDSTKGERLTDWWRATLWPSYVSFQSEDFAQATYDAGARPLIDDRLVALSLAFKLYVEGGRKADRRMLLKKVASSSDEITVRLKELMHPPPQSDATLQSKRINAACKRRTEKQKLGEQNNRAEWHRYLVDNVNMLRDPGFDDPTAIWGLGRAALSFRAHA